MRDTKMMLKLLGASISLVALLVRVAPFTKVDNLSVLHEVSSLCEPRITLRTRKASLAQMQGPHVARES